MFRSNRCWTLFSIIFLLLAPGISAAAPEESTPPPNPAPTPPPSGANIKAQCDAVLQILGKPVTQETLDSEIETQIEIVEALRERRAQSKGTPFVRYTLEERATLTKLATDVFPNSTKTRWPISHVIHFAGWHLGVGEDNVDYWASRYRELLVVWEELLKPGDDLIATNVGVRVSPARLRRALAKLEEITQGTVLTMPLVRALDYIESKNIAIDLVDPRVSFDGIIAKQTLEQIDRLRGTSQFAEMPRAQGIFPHIWQGTFGGAVRGASPTIEIPSYPMIAGLGAVLVHEVQHLRQLDEWDPIKFLGFVKAVLPRDPSLPALSLATRKKIVRTAIAGYFKTARSWSEQDSNFQRALSILSDIAPGDENLVALVAKTLTEWESLQTEIKYTESLSNHPHQQMYRLLYHVGTADCVDLDPTKPDFGKKYSVARLAETYQIPVELIDHLYDTLKDKTDLDMLKSDRR